MGRVRLNQAEPGAPLDVRVTVSVRFGRPMSAVVDEMREGVRSAIEHNGDLKVGRVDVTVGDVHTDEGEDE